MTVTLAVGVAPVRAVAVLASAQAVAASSDDRSRLSRALDRGLYDAAAAGHLEDITAMVGADANVNATIDGDGSPLIAAARTGSLAAVDLLLDAEADSDLIVRGDGSPLIMAAQEGHSGVVERLLDRGASIDQVAPGDENALIQASAQGQLAVVRLLVERGANVNARVRVTSTSIQDRDEEWRTPLMMARRGGHQAVVSYLVDAGAQD